MRKLFVTLVAVAAVAAFSAPSLAKNNDPIGHNSHAHKGGTKPDPRPSHGKDNNSAGGGCDTIC